MSAKATGNARPAPLAAAAEWVARDGMAALATVIETWGSAPVPVGGVMAIARDGRFEGSVSGGCIEAEILTEAEACFADGARRALAFGVADETAWGAGLPCGGKVRVLLERLERDRDGALVTRMADVADRRAGLVVSKPLGDGPATIAALDQPDLSPTVAERVRSGRSGVAAGPAGELFVHVLVPPARILAIGATHISQVLATLARTTGFEIQVIDPRTAFATPERFGGVTLHTDWPEAALARIGIDAFTAVAVLAHVDHIDDEALTVALRSPARYVGALGSKRTHGRRIERLRAAGLSELEIARIRNPIGLDIGAVTPQEIALSVMAEIVAAVRR